MMPRRAGIVASWALCMAAALWLVAQAHYVTDLSAFLPAKPTPVQKLLVEQLRDGPAARLILIALEGGDAAARAAVSMALARHLRQDSAFSRVDNGEILTADRDREFLFQHRYLLSDSVTPERFTVDGLRSALAETIEGLASPAGLLLKSLVPRDPTGEMLHIVDQLSDRPAPRTEDGVWVSTDGARTLLVAQTLAAGSDTDAQERAIDAVHAAFDAVVSAAGSGTVSGTVPGAVPTAGATIHLQMSGPGVFAVAARDKIKRAATRLSVVSSVLVITVLLAVYRSVPALGLGLLPVASGALVGIAAVALGFGVVHGITLGFGITLIGESVDYSIYFFIQSLRRDALTPDGDATGATWLRTLWPTIRLGMLTSACGFASLLPSGFPGLAQLGLYSISGLVTAALVTRFLLPALLPAGLRIRDVSALGRRIGRLLHGLRRGGDRILIAVACVIAGGAMALLYAHRDHLWNTELSALSPIAAEDLRFDAQLRADLGAADVLDVVIVTGRTLEAVLEGAERAAGTLQSLVETGVIGGFDTATSYLPSFATQKARRDALPEATTLANNLRRAAVGLDLDAAQLSPFLSDVAAARGGALQSARDLRGTSLAAAFSALLVEQPGRFSALLPLHAPPHDGTAAAAIDVLRVTRALAAAHLRDTQMLDIKTETDALYLSYLDEAMHLSLAGLACIILLLAIALRSLSRVVRVLLPLLLAVLTVAAALVLCGGRLTILHLVGMLLIVAVGSNYALFFDRQTARADDATAPLTLASLAIANLCTVIGFGLLSFSQVPVLEALGNTVGPGAFLALVFSALLTSRRPAPPAARAQPV